MAPRTGKGSRDARELQGTIEDCTWGGRRGRAADHADGESPNERPLFIAISASTRAPIGWIEFCSEYAPECETRPLEARDVVLTSKAWKDLVRINKWVNDQVKPVTDMEHWGVVERWSYPDDGYGDCEDYVLL